MRNHNFIWSSLVCLSLLGCNSETTESESVDEQGTCSGVGEIIEESSGECVCDTSKHWIGKAGSCECENGYTNHKGVCEEELEQGPCSGVGEIIEESSGECVCDKSKHWTGEAGSCECEGDLININGVCDKTDNCKGNGVTIKDKICMCNAQLHWTGKAGNCTCEKDHFEIVYHNVDYACCDKVDYATDFSQPSCWELENPQKGNICLLGKYRQLRKTDEKQPIQWRVLDIDQGTGNLLLITEFLLDILPYNKTKKDVTWETCTLRSWLNAFDSSANADGIDYTKTGFLKTAFTDAEREHIVTATNYNLDHPTAHTPGGNSTEDKVFLLSREDTRTYFSSRLAYGTSYTTSNAGMLNTFNCRGQDTSEFQYPLPWWTRSCSVTADQARCISVWSLDCDMEVNSDGMTVRPVLWLTK